MNGRICSLILGHAFGSPFCRVSPAGNQDHDGNQCDEARQNRKNRHFPHLRCLRTAACHRRTIRTMTPISVIRPAPASRSSLGKIDIFLTSVFVNCLRRLFLPPDLYRHDKDRQGPRRRRARQNQKRAEHGSHLPQRPLYCQRMRLSVRTSLCAWFVSTVLIDLVRLG